MASMDSIDLLLVPVFLTFVWIMSEFETSIYQGIDLSAFYVLHLLRPYGTTIFQIFSPGILTGHSGWEGIVQLVKQLIKQPCTLLKHNTLVPDWSQQMGLPCRCPPAQQRWLSPQSWVPECVHACAMEQRPCSFRMWGLRRSLSFLTQEPVELPRSSF